MCVDSDGDEDSVTVQHWLQQRLAEGVSNAGNLFDSQPSEQQRRIAGEFYADLNAATFFGRGIHAHRSTRTGFNF